MVHCFAHRAYVSRQVTQESARTNYNHVKTQDSKEPLRQTQSDRTVSRDTLNSFDMCELVLWVHARRMRPK